MLPTRPIQLVPIQQCLSNSASSHAVGEAGFGLFESGALPPASARWAMVGGGLGVIKKVRNCPRASNSCPLCPIQCLAHHPVRLESTHRYV